MPAITLKRAQVQTLVDHCAKFDLKQWFIAKDQGAYVGASAGTGKEKQCIFYFKGCNPDTDKEWYETARHKFGGDDFGEHMQVDDLKSALADQLMTSLRVEITATQIKVDRIRGKK